MKVKVIYTAQKEIDYEIKKKYEVAAKQAIKYPRDFDPDQSEEVYDLKKEIEATLSQTDPDYDHLSAILVEDKNGDEYAIYEW